MKRLDGKVCIVTGAAQGLGEAMVRSIVAEGGKVMVADLNGEKAKAVAEQLNGAGEAVAASCTVDVAERSQVKAMIQATVKAFGRVDVLFNNAGFNKAKPFMEADEENFNEIMRVNGLSVLIGIQEIGRYFQENNIKGKIINTASITGRQGYANSAPYSASKAAVISLTQSGARALAPNITVNAIAPGVVQTPLWDRLEEEFVRSGEIEKKGDYLAAFKEHILIKRVAPPSELGGVAVFMASSDSDHMTGQTLMCDGGMVLV